MTNKTDETDEKPDDETEEPTEKPEKGEQETGGGDQPKRDLLRQTYDMATQDLRNKYRQEFVQMRKERAAELGVEWSPRQTAEEKAEIALDLLLDEYPHLVDKVKSRD